MRNNKLIMGAAIGNCVHVAGVSHFLDIAEAEGYTVKFLGPSVDLNVLFKMIEEYKPDMVAIGYRLTPENVEILLKEVSIRKDKLEYSPVWCFGGTKPVAEVAKKYDMFSYISDGMDDIKDSIRFLRGESNNEQVDIYPQTLGERIKESYPYPILRHHYGLPSLEETINGVKRISEAKVLDVISLGTDQNAQQFFFKQEEMKKEYDGAGGVPVRCKEDLKALKEASMCGNFPLMRCYSGTEDLLKNAEMLQETINNAWAAIPLSWYSELDGRSTRPIEKSIEENQNIIKWHSEKNIPVEINEPHHWGLRDAHDVMSVAMAYVSAYNAKKLGVKEYIAQYMFNNPNGLSFSMDLARVLAMIELVESLHDENFTTYRETRAGLPLFNADIDVAKGQLSASTFMQMAVKPHIIHVVAYCEADHAASAEEVISSCKIVKGVINHTISDDFAMQQNDKIKKRKEELVREAKILIQFIEEKFSEYDDPLTNSEVLSECIKRGYLDAVHIVKNDKFKGNLATKFMNGKCVAYDKVSGTLLDEETRLKRL